MLHEDLVVRNIDVLKSLGEGGSLTIDGLVDSMSGRYKRGNVELSLRILEDQGLVREDEDRYSLADGGKVNEMLSVVGGWVSYFDSSFIGVARDTARMLVWRMLCCMVLL